MVINVTQQDIDNGIRAVCSACPIALAVTELVDPQFAVRVGTDCLLIYKDLTKLPVVQQPLPWTAGRFILAFDAGQTLQLRDRHPGEIPEMIVNITQEHIDKGARADCSACPIALAVQPLLAGPYQVTVGLVQLDIFKPDTYRPIASAPLTPACQHFINAFDAGSPVQPFSCELDIPPEYLK